MDGNITYDLTNVAIQDQQDNDRLKLLRGKTVNIAGFVGTNNNWIENITIEYTL